MLTPQRRQQMDAVLGKTAQPTLTPERRAQMDSVLGKNQKTWGGLAGNVVKSGAKLIGDVGGAVINAFNPNLEKNTIANVAKLSTGIVQKLDPTQGNKIAARVPGIGLVQKYAGDQEQVADNVGQFYKQRYGGKQNIIDTVYTDPVGVVADAATLFSGAGGALRGGGAVASKIGSVSKAAKLTQAGKTLTNLGTKIDPIVAAGKGISAVGGKISSRVKPALFSRADEMITAGIGNPAQQAKAAQKGGRSVSSFIDEYNLYDRSPDTAKQLVDDIGERFDTSAMSTNKNIQISQIVKAFDDEIAKLSEGTGGQIADATAQKIAELQRRRQMFLNSITTDTASPLQVPLQQVTDFRRKVIDPDVPKSEFGLNPKDAGQAGGVKAARDIFRRESIKVAPELEKLGLDYGMAKELENILKKSEIRKSNRQLFNFTKMGGGGLGGLVAGAPGVVGGFLLEQIVNNPTFIKLASKGLKQALSAKLPQNKLTKTTGKIAGGLYQTGRFGRLIGNQTQPRSTSTQTLLDPQQETPPYQNYTLLDKIAEQQGLDVNEMRKKRLNFARYTP